MTAAKEQWTSFCEISKISLLQESFRKNVRLLLLVTTSIICWSNFIVGCGKSFHIHWAHTRQTTDKTMQVGDAINYLFAKMKLWNAQYRFCDDTLWSHRLDAGARRLLLSNFRCVLLWAVRYTRGQWRIHQYIVCSAVNCSGRTIKSYIVSRNFAVAACTRTHAATAQV